MEHTDLKTPNFYIEIRLSKQSWNMSSICSSSEHVSFGRLELSLSSDGSVQNDTSSDIDQKDEDNLRVPDKRGTS